MHLASIFNILKTYTEKNFNLLKRKKTTKFRAHT